MINVEIHLILSNVKMTSSSGRKLTSGTRLSLPLRRKQTRFGVST